MTVFFYSENTSSHKGADCCREYDYALCRSGLFVSVAVVVVVPGEAPA